MYNTLLSVFAGGLWVIPTLTILAAIISYYRGYRQSKSGSIETYNGGATRESKTNVPFYKCTATVYGYIFTAASVGIILLMLADK